MAPKSKQNSTRTGDKIQQEPKATSPKWPAFDPLIPSGDLSIEVLVPNQIVVIHNFFTSTLCKKYVSFLASLPLSTTSGKPKRGDALRVNDRFQIEDATFAQRLWDGTALCRLVQKAESLDQDDQPNDSQHDIWGGEVVRIISAATGI